MLPGVLHIVVDRKVHTLNAGLIVGHPHTEDVAKLTEGLQQKDVEPLEGVPAIALLAEGDPVLVGRNLVVDLGIVLILQHGDLGGYLVDCHLAVGAFIPGWHVAVLAAAGLLGAAKLILKVTVEPLQIRRLLNPVHEALEVWVLFGGQQLGKLLPRWLLSADRWLAQRPVDHRQVDHMAGATHSRRLDIRVVFGNRPKGCLHRLGDNVFERAVELAGRAHLELAGN